MHNPHVVLWRANIARILPGNPRVSGLKQHANHLAPEVGRGKTLPELYLPRVGHSFVVGVARFKRRPIEVVQVGCLVGREERPLSPITYPLHEEVGDPACGIDVVGAAAFVTRVLTQFSEVGEIVVPALQVDTRSTPATTRAINRRCDIVSNLKEWDDPLALDANALDKGTRSPHGRPVGPEASRPLRELG